MTRTYVREAEPHRDLIVTNAEPAGGWQRGADVRALLEAAERRLDARGIDRELSAPELDHVRADALVTTARLLGALESTLAKRDGKGRAVLTVGAQQMIRYPGRRTDAQLARAEVRMEQLLKDRDKRERAQAASPSSPGHLGAEQRAEARDRAVRAMRLLLAHAPAVHYTQGPRRWDGIRQGLRSAEGHYPRYADCSSAYSWALWNALTGVAGKGYPDVVNGSRWTAGYTGTLLTHGRAVSMSDLQPGDAIIYGRGFPGVHVAMYVGAGRVISHGSEAGPYLLAARYRGDVMGARRFIL